MATHHAHWLAPDDPQRLLDTAQAAPWDKELLSEPRIIPATWDPASHRDHQILWCPLSDGAVAIHRLHLNMSDEHIAELRSQLHAEMSLGECGETASNVGGFHGERDLWWRLRDDIQTQIVTAVENAASVEASALRRPAIPTSPDEAWFNVLGPGGFNQLHTHPGSTYSGVLYVDSPMPNGVQDSLAGRLCLVPNAYADLNEDANGEYHFEGFKFASTGSNWAEQVAHIRSGDLMASIAASDSRFLVIDPTPGTCIIFPSFIPHFVFPMPDNTPPKAQRLSIAFNFGHCEPVVAHLRTSGAGVRLMLEAVSGLAFRMPRGDRGDPQSRTRGQTPDCLPPVAKRARRSEHSPEIKPLCVELEARRCPGGERGNGVFALVDLPPGWMFRDHPICIAASGEDKTRRLPAFEEVDDLMREIATNAEYQEMMGGPWQMSHVQRHFDAQETTEDELPEWATQIGLALDEYNLLAAQLQTQVAREEQGGGLICLPKIRLVNHACDANTEIAYAPELEAGCCPCGLGHYVLRAIKHIRAGDEITFSYIGASTLMEAEAAEQRRQLLQRRWDFRCECVRCVEQMDRS